MNNLNILFLLFVIAGVIYVLDEKYNKQPVLEKPLGKNARRKRKSYAEFVALAKVDPKAVIGIPWVQLPDLDGYLPTYLKYKEKILTPIIDQGRCASCWSISVVQMLSDRISVYTGGRVMEPLSCQEMVSCWPGSKGDQGCLEGGIPELAYNYIIKNGVGLKKDYPYQQRRSTRVNKCDESRLKGKRLFVEPDSVRSLCIDPNKFEEGGRRYRDIIDLNVKNMKKELLINGPFVCTVYVHKNLYNFNSMEGVYLGPDGSDYIGGHSVVVIGYCEEGINGVEPGFDVPYWIVRNSWSDWPAESPASEGYFYIKMGSNVAGIESRASRALPVISDDVRSKMVKSLDESRYTSITDWVEDPERQNLITKVGKIRSLLKKIG